MKNHSNITLILLQGLILRLWHLMSLSTVKKIVGETVSKKGRQDVDMENSGKEGRD